MPRTSNPRALRRIAQAIQYGAYYNADAGAAGGGGGSPAAAPVVPAKPEAKPSEPEKIQLTQAEIDAKVEAAVKAQADKAEKKAQKEREDADRKAAEEQGKFKELADKERAEKEAALAENRTLKTATALRDHLAEKHADYANCAKYILPLIPTGMEGDDLTKAIEKATAEYVKDNPRQPKGAVGAASSHRAITPPPAHNGNGKPQALSSIARGF